jgi:hypothetical protein
MSQKCVSPPVLGTISPYMIVACPVMRCHEPSVCHASVALVRMLAVRAVASRLTADRARESRRRGTSTSREPALRRTCARECDRAPPAARPAAERAAPVARNAS